ncbi:hypothetical protein K6U06_04285 [Acidiferrimicrobium sp. IK]|uniref:hypothetical protein n=1 Tax=Acidiferrimicrobium sp. IK TaxID=2871700 RepID=UPI0021CB2741|nr:hypothetical protein [Acidiferrimicrobium sp. IK]MCU4183566.1 hypothetical protein [Acidiferrimicrobium sp. IK]
MSIALASEAADLRAAAAAPAATTPTRSEATITRVTRADDLLTARLAAASVKRVQVTDPPRLHAGDELLALLARQSDRPVPISLLEYTGSALAADDLQTGRFTRLPPAPFAPSAIIARAGYDVLTDGRGVAILPDTPGATIVPVPGAATATAATRPDRFWVTDTTGDITEVDGSGRAAGAPIRLPSGWNLAGAVPAGLVLTGTDSGGVEIVDPSATKLLRAISTDPRAAVLDVAGSTVAWTVAQPGGFAGPLYLTDAATGRTVKGQLPLLATYGPGQLSPDGHRFAGYFTEGSAKTLGQLCLVDVATGSYRSEQLVGTPSAVTWSPGGRWLVAVTAEGGGDALDTATGSSTALRFSVQSGPFAVLP